MPAGPRIRDNNVFGAISDNPLTAGAGSFNSPQLALLSAVSSAHAVVTFDPLRQFGEPEIAIVTVHTASATVASITRGAYGTTPRSHPQGTIWAHAPIDEDVTEIVTSGTRPSDPYEGQTIFETDTNRYVGRSTAGIWQQDGLFFDPPACRVYHDTTQSIANQTVTALVFNSERYDTDTMHSTVSLTSRMTINTPGLYVITGSIEWPAATDFTQLDLYIRPNGNNAEILADESDRDPGTANVTRGMTVATTMKFNAAEYVELVVRQVNGATAARNVNSTPQFSPEFSATWIGRGN